MSTTAQTIERVRAQPAPPGSRPTFRVWFTIVLLFLATVLNYLDRQTLAVAAPVIREEMGLSLEQIGLLFRPSSGRTRFFRSSQEFWSTG